MPAVVHLIAAARPNFMKVAPLWHALDAAADFRPLLVHSGQHYDSNMSSAFFEDLSLPPPDHHLGVGSGSHAEQTGRVMIAYEPVALADCPDWVVVAGDVNTTVACAMVAAKLQIPLVHLEAGLRSGDRSMPEELNRLVTDCLSDVLWTPSPDADRNLLAEGVKERRITNVGNIMLDSFELVRGSIESADYAARLSLDRRGYGVLTLHRPSNVDDEGTLRAIAEALLQVNRRLPLVFPVHPRTRAKLGATGVGELLAAGGVRMIDPLPYVGFMSLVMNSAAVITDSGGVQEETTYLGIPCLTLRPNTERPITIEQGTNRLVNPSNLLATLDAALGEPPSSRRRPAGWDGRTAQRCVEDLRRRSLTLEEASGSPVRELREARS